MTRDTLLELIEGAAEYVIPVIGKAVQGLLAGKPPEQVLDHAERQLLADAAQQRLDDALAHKPVIPGT
jgi:hypothetical protein